MSKFKEELKKLKPLNFLLLTLSGTINAIGIVFFLAPVNLFDSGFSGTAMFFNEITGIPLAVFLLVLNIPFFIFGYKRQGTVFTIYSIYAVLIYSLASFVITNILPIDVSSSSPFAGTDLLLCAIFGGLISGVGSGLTIRFDLQSSSDGSGSCHGTLHRRAYYHINVTVVHSDIRRQSFRLTDAPCGKADIGSSAYDITAVPLGLAMAGKIYFHRVLLCLFITFL